MADNKKTNTEESKSEKVVTIAEVEQKYQTELAKKDTREAMKLVHCIVTCNNKNKTNYQGEIFCVRNADIPAVKKFIPFGVPTHIPQILLNSIKEHKYQTFVKQKVNGNLITKPKFIDEYVIQELPPLTAEELEAIKQRQLADPIED